MPLYENVFVARQDVAQTQIDALTQQYADLVASGGGTVSKKEYWGLRQLSYRIKKNRKAHFMLLNIDAPPAAILELERNQTINEDVIRFMTVRVDKLDEEPSAMMRKDRDERDGERMGGDRGDRGPRGPRREFGARDRGDRPERPRFAGPSATPGAGEAQ